MSEMYHQNVSYPHFLLAAHSFIKKTGLHGNNYMFKVSQKVKLHLIL